MMITPSRRTVLVTGASALAVGAAMIATAPAGATAGRRLAPAKAQITNATLVGVSVAPHSKAAFAFGNESTKTSSAQYGLKRSGSHWKKLKIGGLSGATLTGIATGSPKSIWIVGSVYTNAENRGLIVHSTGGAFKVQKHLSTGQSLIAVAASSPKNAWAVGFDQSGTPLALHGTGHKWKRATFPSADAGLNLNSVSVSSNSNAWMLGTNGALAGAAHWNGHHFTVTQIPVPANSTLRAIATTGAKETWVVGTSEVTKGSKSLSKILAMHWNGTKWSRVKTPSPYPNSYPMAITASGKHVYIAGSGGAYSNPKGFDQHAFVLSLKGQRWKSQHVASVGVTSSFTSVSTSSKASVAVGASYNGYVCGGKVVTTSPLAESRHGTSWGRESAPKLRFGTPQHRPWSATPLARSC